MTVHEVGQEDGRVYVAMELVDGRDLEGWIAENSQRPWQSTLEVFIDAGKGLAAAHARGILHRDFKPANVEVQEGKLEPNHPTILASLDNIASTHLVLGSVKATASRLLAASEGRDDYVARAHFLLAQASLAAGDRSEARRAGREALGLYEALSEPSDDLADLEAFMKDLD